MTSTSAAAAFEDVLNAKVDPSWAAANPTTVQVLDTLRDELRYTLARADPNVFCELVGRDEETGRPIKQAPVHRAFQELASNHDRLVIWSHFEVGKTNQLSILRALWELGRNRNLRVAIVSRSGELAVKIVRTLKAYIETSTELQRVFPRLRPGRKWTDNALTFYRAGVGPKDYSAQAFGIGSTIQGGRIDLAILDDVLDWNNTRTPAQRADVTSWYFKLLSPRLTSKARVIVVGNAWHPDDLLHVLATNQVWTARRFPVVDDATGKPRWPERWPLSRIRAWELEYGAAEAARALYCVARSDEDSRFKQAWIDRCLMNGDGRSMPNHLRGVPLGYRTYTGVDVSTGEAEDTTVLFTIVVHPNGQREVLCVEQGRWSGPEIVRRVFDHHRRYLSIVSVESNAAQRFISQFAREMDANVPVRNFNTGENKTDPVFGIESLAVEMERGQWIIPSLGGRPLTKEVDGWLRDLLHYSPAAHTPDTLMAQWIAREATRAKPPKRVRSGNQNLMRR